MRTECACYEDWNAFDRIKARWPAMRSHHSKVSPAISEPSRLSYAEDRALILSPQILTHRPRPQSFLCHAFQRLMHSLSRTGLWPHRVWAGISVLATWSPQACGLLDLSAPSSMQCTHLSVPAVFSDREHTFIFLCLRGREARGQPWR